MGSEARFCVVCLLSKSRTRPCVLQIGNFILCVKICTPPILMSFPPPVLIAGSCNFADDWVPQTVSGLTTTQNTQISGSPGLKSVFNFIADDYGGLPNNYLRKSSPSSLCGQTEVVLCALQFHSLETSCFSHRGLALAPHLLTSTSFGYGC